MHHFPKAACRFGRHHASLGYHIQVSRIFLDVPVFDVVVLPARIEQVLDGHSPPYEGA